MFDGYDDYDWLETPLTSLTLMRQAAPVAQDGQQPAPCRGALSRHLYLPA